MVRGKNGKGYGVRPRGGASPCKTLLSTFPSGNTALDHDWAKMPNTSCGKLPFSE